MLAALYYLHLALFFPCGPQPFKNRPVTRRLWTTGLFVICTPTHSGTCDHRITLFALMYHNYTRLVYCRHKGCGMIDVIMSWNSQQHRIIDANILFMWIIQTDGGSWDRCSVDVLFFVLDRLFLRRDWGRMGWLWPRWRKRASKWSLLASVSPPVLLPILCMSFSFIWIKLSRACWHTVPIN